MHFRSYSLSNSKTNLIPNQNYQNKYDYFCNCCKCHCQCCCCQCPCQCKCHRESKNKHEENYNNFNPNIYCEQINYPQNFKTNFQKLNSRSLQNLISPLGKKVQNSNNYINPINFSNEDVEGYNNQLIKIRLNEEKNFRTNNNSLSNTTNDNSPIQSSPYYSPFNNQNIYYDKKIDIDRVNYPNGNYNSSNGYELNNYNEYNTPKQNNKYNRKKKSFSINRKNINIRTIYNYPCENVIKNNEIPQRYGSENRDENSNFLNNKNLNNYYIKSQNNLGHIYQKNSNEIPIFSKHKRNNMMNQNKSFGNLLRKDNKLIGKRNVLNTYKQNVSQFPKNKIYSNRKNKLYIQKFSLNIFGQGIHDNNEYNTEFQNNDSIIQGHKKRN